MGLYCSLRYYYKIFLVLGVIAVVVDVVIVVLCGLHGDLRIYFFFFYPQYEPLTTLRDVPGGSILVDGLIGNFFTTLQEITNFT